LAPKEPDTKCNALKSGGRGYCRAGAGANTWHPGVGRCSRHGGSNPAYTNEVHRLRAKQAAEKYGAPVEIDPHTALIQELERTAGHVLFLQLKVHELEESKMVGPVGGGQGAIPEWKPNVWISLYQSERKHLIDVAKSCIAAGIEERRVQLAERQGQLLAEAIQGILHELGVDKRPEAPSIVRRHLMLLTPGNGNGNGSEATG
jgi:hypothetical protein